MPIRLNPPERLSLADHFDKEATALQKEHKALAAHGRLAIAMGYNFEGREDTLSLLRQVDMMAQGWTTQVSDGVIQDKPDQKFVGDAIRRVAEENGISSSLLVSAKAQEGPSI